MMETTAAPMTGAAPIRARAPVVDQIFGHNKAPIVAVLDADFADMKAKIGALTDELREATKNPPKDDEGFGKIGALIVKARGFANRADEIRTAEKAPILEAGRALDAWFKNTLSDMGAQQSKLQGMADAYARQKAAEARAKAEREAAEARAKAEAERQRADAAKSVTAAANAEARAENLEAKADAAAAQAAASDADLVRARVGGVTASATGAWVATITDYQAAIAPLGAVGMFLKREALESALGAMAKTQKHGAAWPGVLFAQETKATFR